MRNWNEKINNFFNKKVELYNYIALFERARLEEMEGINPCASYDEAFKIIKNEFYQIITRICLVIFLVIADNFIILNNSVSNIVMHDMCHALMALVIASLLSRLVDCTGQMVLYPMKKKSTYVDKEQDCLLPKLGVDDDEDYY